MIERKADMVLALSVAAIVIVIVIVIVKSANSRRSHSGDVQHLLDARMRESEAPPTAGNDDKKEK